MSFESPGTLLNLTKAKTPPNETAFAISLPIRVITTLTIIGKITRVTAKFEEYLRPLLLIMYDNTGHLCDSFLILILGHF